MPSTTWAVTSALVAALTLSPSAAQKAIEVFDAQAVNPNATDGMVAGPVQIQIHRWSTDTERDRVMSAITEGSEKLVELLSSLDKVGTIRTPGTVGYDLRYARKTTAASNTEQVFIITDRPLAQQERATRARSIDYPFTVIELRVRPDGVGEGKMSIGTKVAVNKMTKAIELENYAVSPITLQNVRRAKN